MKTMHHIIYRALFLMALVLITLPALAQRHHRPSPEQFQQHLERMQEQLNLTEAQVQQMEAIHEKYGPQMQALHEAEGGFDHEQARELHESLEGEMEKVLSQEQMDQLKEMHEQRGHGPKGMGIHGHHRSGKGDRPEMKAARKEVRAYMKENVMPVLREERRKFDDQLSGEDKAAIAQLRAEMQAHRPEMKEHRKEMRQMRQQGDRPTEEQRTEMRAFREQRHAIFEEVGQIAERYEAELKAIHEFLQPQSEQWQADMQAIMEKYRAEGADSDEGFHHRGKKHHRHGMAGQMGRHMKAVKFLLMDPDGTMLPEEMQGDLPEAPALDVYPNPTMGNNRIQYEVKQAGNVTIELVTKEGSLIRQLLQQYHEPGEYSLDVDLNGTRTNVYYYRVTDATGARVKRFTVVK